jgi:hypothetical protein
MTRRTLLGTAGWFAVAVLAVLIGMAAVRVIGDGLTSGAGRPRSPAEVDRELAARTTGTPTGSAAAPAPASASASTGSGVAPAGALRSFRTGGGTVVARCVRGRAEIVAMSPLSGFAVHERDAGPRGQAEGEFRGTAKDHDRVKVRVTCAGDRPALAERAR